MLKDQEYTRKLVIRGKIEEREKKREENCGRTTSQKEHSIQERSKINFLRTS